MFYGNYILIRNKMKSFKAKFHKNGVHQVVCFYQKLCVATGVLQSLRKLLLLGKSLVYYFVLSVPVYFSIVTVVMENILSLFPMFNFQWFSWRVGCGCRSRHGQAGDIHCNQRQCIGGSLRTLVSHSNYF